MPLEYKISGAMYFEKVISVMNFCSTSEMSIGRNYIYCLIIACLTTFLFDLQYFCFTFWIRPIFETFDTLFTKPCQFEWEYLYMYCMYHIISYQKGSAFIDLVPNIAKMALNRTKLPQQSNGNHEFNFRTRLLHDIHCLFADTEYLKWISFIFCPHLRRSVQIIN